MQVLRILFFRWMKRPDIYLSYFDGGTMLDRFKVSKGEQLEKALFRVVLFVPESFICFFRNQFG